MVLYPRARDIRHRISIDLGHMRITHLNALQVLGNKVNYDIPILALTIFFPRSLASRTTRLLAPQNEPGAIDISA